MESMSPDVERTIVHFYPRRALSSPLLDDGIAWSWDADNAILKALLSDLEALDGDLAPGTRGGYDVSEELIAFGDVRVQLSYLGPFAAIDYGTKPLPRAERPEFVARVRDALRTHGYLVLSQTELDEEVPWIHHGGATVWACLFVPSAH